VSEFLYITDKSFESLNEVHFEVGLLTLQLVTGLF
jgi:hypothetical protein